MSSSLTFNYEPGDELRLHKQVANVHKIILEHQRPADLISRALQAVISDDHIVVEPKIAITPTGRTFNVTGNFRSASQLIDSLACPVKWDLAEKPSRINMIVQPVDCKGRVIRLGQTYTTKEIYKLYPKIFSPAEFLTFGVNFSEEQCEAPHLTIWLDSSGQFWYATLDVDGGKRGVGAGRCRPNDPWTGNYRVPSKF